MKGLLLISVLLVLTVHSKNVHFKVCEPKPSASVQNVSIIPCEAEPCIFHRGKSVEIDVDFTPTKAAQKLTTKVHGRIGGVWLPFPLDHDDACTTSGITCPLVAGTQYHFNYSLPVKTIYPALEVVVKWEFVDQEGSEVVCMQIPVKLQ